MHNYTSPKNSAQDLISCSIIGARGYSGLELARLLLQHPRAELMNCFATSDFNLIKDIVERNCDSVEEDINQTISIPLYLGLLGTFLGIIMGLLQISGMDYNSTSNGLGEAISILLKGVQIAMFASFTGLFLTVLNSGVFMKGAK